MPRFSKQNLVRLVLPSTAHLPEEQQAVVYVNSRLSIGDLMSINQADTDEQRGYVMLAAVIKDWNNTVSNDSSEKLAINADTIREEIDQNDFMFLSEWVNEHITKSLNGLTTEQKKTSSSVSIPVTDTPTPNI